MHLLLHDGPTPDRMIMFETVTPHIYYVLLLSVCLLALLYGSRDELAGAAILLCGSVLTTILAQFFAADWTGFSTHIFYVDAAALVAFIALAISSDRFWPIWATAFHLVAVTIHIATEVAPDLHKWALATGAALWGYLMIGVVALGVRENLNRETGEQRH